MTIIPQDQSRWTSTVIQAFLTEFPSLQKQVLSVKWHKRNTDKGYGVGSIHVLNGGVPVIIKDYKMSPFDVIFLGTTPVPLTPETLESLLFEPTPFKSVAPSKMKPYNDMFVGDNNLHFSPAGDNRQVVNGNNSYTRDAVKTASFIDRIGPIESETVLDMFQELKSISQLSDSFEKNGTSHLLNKIYNKRDPKQVKTASSVTHDRRLVYKDSLGNTRAKVASSKLNMTWDVLVPQSEVSITKNLIAPTITNQTEKVASVPVSGQPRVGETGWFEFNGEKTPEMEISALHVTKPLEKNAYFKFKYDDGGIVVNTEREYVILDRTGRTKVATALEFGCDIPEEKRSYILVQNEVALTRPFVVTNFTKVANIGHSYFTAHDGLSEKRYYPIPSTFDGLRPHDHEKNAEYVPRDAKLIKLSQDLLGGKVYSRPQEIHEHFMSMLKTANANTKLLVEGEGGLQKISVYISDNIDHVKKATENVYVVPSTSTFYLKDKTVKTAELKKVGEFVGRDSSGLFYVRGPVLAKYAKEASKEDHNLSKLAAMWYATHCGASQEDLNRIEKLGYSNVIELKNNLTLPIAQDKVIKVASAQMSRISEGPEFRTLLLKEAASFKDPVTVDAILSLGLMKKYNIRSFFPLVPEYENVMSSLAMLLTAIRLGTVGSIEEDVVKTTMESLAAVVYVLKSFMSLSRDRGVK